MDHLRAVQFPEAGDGIQIIFRNRDILALRKKYGENYLEIVEKGIQTYDMEVIELCLAVGAKDRDGKPAVVTIDDVDSIPMSMTAERLLDAYSLSASGRTFKEHLAWAQEQVAKLMGGEGADRPLLDQGVFSEASSAPPSGQELPTPTSGK